MFSRSPSWPVTCGKVKVVFAELDGKSGKFGCGRAAIGFQKVRYGQIKACRRAASQ